jgi:hypothetical protein
MRIPIKALKDVAKKYGLSHIIMLAHQIKDNMDHVVTYGDTIEHCSEAADFGNKLKISLGWPESLQAQPSRVKKLQNKIKELEKELDEIKNPNKEYNNGGCNVDQGPEHWSMNRRRF